ncbi:MAG: glycosyltransferase family 2 protein [Lunatimonas sp.]|uniref:glycosyltransferase family 2 protein n=1 Tax=Lunatimonas sp. TaxID=2060141 RepID=UPI00263AA6B3|nr:glycosyltransferase family 2 protein [Lunatimonas sp.]MCC5935922.1 glycosyltransferase family 2 protein [Lunatimonas sp.]
MKQPLVSIITINYNGLEHTLGMLQSFRKINYPNLEYIVVDNASKEDPSPILEAYPEVILVPNPVNEGFAGGNNRGMEIAKGEYFYLINNDTEILPDSIDALLKRAQSDTKVGLVCPKIRYYDEPDIIQYAGYTPISKLTGRGTAIGYMERDAGQYDQARVTALAHGAAMFIPRSVVEEVGMMAELYFLYYEELDYCERIKKAGFEIWYEPASVILHKESMSVGKKSLLKTYYMSRNRWVFLRRNIEWPIFAITMIYYFLIAVPKNVLFYLFKGETSHAKAYLRGFFNSFTIKNLHDNPELKPLRK